MDRGTTVEQATFGQRRIAVQDACAALTRVDEVLWAAGGAGLGELAGLLDELGRRVDAARVEVLREAVDRGEAGPGRSGASAWLLDHSPGLRGGGSARVVRVAEATTDDRYAALLGAVRATRVPLVTAAVVVDEFERLAPRLAERAEVPVMAGWVGRGRLLGPGEGRPRTTGTAGGEVRAGR
jgi:hypothetical protein